MADTEHADKKHKDTFGYLGTEPGTIKEQYAELLAALEKAVKERPLLAVGIAVAAGFLLGALRRR